MSPHVLVLLSGAASAVLPLLGGWSVGLLLRALRGGRRSPAWQAIWSLLGGVVVAESFYELAPDVGVWDAWFTAAWTAFGLALGLAASPVRALAGTLVLLPLTALLLEFAARRTLAPVQHLPNATEARWSIPLRFRDPPCEGLFPDAAYWSMRDPATAPTDARPRVLHVGDSMIQPVFVDPEDGVVARLGRAEPSVRHLNAGIRYSGPDAYWVYVRRWLARGRLDAVVLHVFAGNDLLDVGRGCQCCGGHAIVSFRTGTPSIRCVQEHEPDDLLTRWTTSPAPFLARTFSEDSLAAAHLAADLPRLLQGNVPSDVLLQLGGDPLHRLDRFEAVLRAIHDELAAHHVPAWVTVLPYRPALERAAGGTPSVFDVYAHNDMDARWVHTQTVERCRRAGFEVFDAWDLVAEAARAESLDALLLREDVHFTPHGHALYTRWLLDRVAPRWHGAQASSVPVEEARQPEGAPASQR